MKEKVSIIVVDDEPISADALSELIVAHFSPLMTVDMRTAYHGSTVLEMVNERPCELLISDIQMPGMSGLKLAEALRHRHPDMCILFLTGFDDFNYAYEAFRQNAAGYVLKTEGDEAILAAIQEVIDRLQNRQQMIASIREAESRFTQMLPAYRLQQLMQLLLGAISQEGVQELRQYECDHLHLMISRADGLQGNLPLQQRVTVLSTVEKVIVDAMGDRLCWSERFQLENTLTWIFSLKEKCLSGDTIFHLVRKARKHLDEVLSTTLFFVVADESVDTDNLKHKYLQLHSMLTHEIMHGATGAAIGHPRAESLVMNETQSALRQQLNQCLRDIGDGAFSLLDKHLPTVTAYLRTSPCPSDPFAEECTATLMGALLAYVNQHSAYVILEGADRVAPRGTPAWLEHIAHAILQESIRQQDYAIQSIAQFMVSYIREHIGDDLSTAHLAEVSGYSSGYLSRVFKQETGSSIHEYITVARMELAVDLLHNTNLRIYEVALSCGYDNTAYFIKVFKAQMGKTPQEFKQEYLARMGQGKG